LSPQPHIARTGWLKKERSKSDALDLDLGRMFSALQSYFVCRGRKTSFIGMAILPINLKTNSSTDTWVSNSLKSIEDVLHFYTQLMMI
jgi:hypothetical protein